MRIVKEDVGASTPAASAPALLLLRNDWVIVGHEVSRREFGPSQTAGGLHFGRIECSTWGVKACMINTE